MDIKKLNNTFKTIRDQLDFLSYNLYSLKGLNKNKNYENSINAVENLKNVLNNQISDIKRELQSKVNEEIDNKYITRLIKTNSIKNEATINRIGKVLGIKKAILDGIIRTSNEKRTIKTAGNKEQSKN